MKLRSTIFISVRLISIAPFSANRYKWRQTISWVVPMWAVISASVMLRSVNLLSVSPNSLFSFGPIFSLILLIVLLVPNLWERWTETEIPESAE